LHRLGQFDFNLPKKVQAHTRIIKGNPRSLISVMNNIIYHTEMKLFEQKRGYDRAEVEINMTPCGGPNYIFPRDKVERLLSESPIGKDNKIIPFLPPYNN
jgi:hypothetical protein